MSNISKHKFYFWKEKTIPELHPEVLHDFQTIWITHVITVLVVGPSWTGPPLIVHPKNMFLEGFFDGMMQKHLSFFLKENSRFGEELCSSWAEK